MAHNYEMLYLNSLKMKSSSHLYSHRLSHCPIHLPQTTTLPLMASATCSLVGFEVTSFSSRGSLRPMISNQSEGTELVDTSL